MRLLSCSLVALLTLGSTSVVSSQDPRGVKLTPVEEGILRLTNARRAEHKLEPLTIDPLLLRSAREHSENQAAQHKMSHNLDGKSPFDRIKAIGYRAKNSGENVAFTQGAPSPEQVLTMWMNSPGHRANILNPAFSQIGVGVGSNGGKNYYTQVFGRPSNSGPVVPPPPPILKKPSAKDSKPSKATGSELERNVVRSSGWLAPSLARSTSTPSENDSTGTGVLVDAKLGLFLTTKHVADGAAKIKIYFPRTGKDGKVETERSHYVAGPPPVVAELVIMDSKRDLAVYRLKSVPADVPALKISDKGVDAGDRIFSVGNPTASGPLWVFAEGKVSQVSKKRLRLNDKQEIAAWIVETQAPLNKGDGGGPIVNEKGELVAINCCVDGTLSNCIELREIRAILDLAREELK